MNNDTTGHSLNATVSLTQDGPWSVIQSKYKWNPWMMRASLCYTAWDQAALDVNIVGNTNRTEPIAYSDPGGHFHTIPNVTHQLIPDEASIKFQDVEARQIMQLEEKDSWIPAPEDTGPIAAMPFMQAYSDMSGISVVPQSYMQGNWSAIMTKNFNAKQTYLQLGSELSAKQYIMADDTLTWIFDDFMQRSGPIAQSMSALVTTLSGMAYYDQLSGFGAEANSTQVFFTEALYPQRMGGFWVVSMPDRLI